MERQGDGAMRGHGDGGAEWTDGTGGTRVFGVGLDSQHSTFNFRLLTSVS